MQSRLKSWALTFVKIAIAVVGLWWVIAHTPWHDQVTILKNKEILAVTLLEDVNVSIIEQTKEEQAKAPLPPKTFKIKIPKAPVHVKIEGQDQKLSLLGPEVNFPAEMVIDYGRLAKVDNTEEPAQQVGLRNLVKQADIRLLIAAWAVLVVPFLVTAWRWQKLMEPQGIKLPYLKCLELTFVGQFYSTFLPGITGGDLVKIIYTSRVIGSKTKSTVTILLDRVIGLLGLMIIAGAAAAIQAPGNTTMRNVALLIGAVLVGLGLGAVVYFSQRLRRKLGLEYLINHSKMPDFVRKADEVLHAYRGAWKILAGALLASLVAQATLPISAWLAGMAFGMTHAHLGHFLAYTPLATLAASVPLSPPAGFGVIEWVLFHFFYTKHLATASQAFALAQAIRFLPIMWNLCGAYWVVTGKYSRHEKPEDAK